MSNDITQVQDIAGLKDALFEVHGNLPSDEVPIHVSSQGVSYKRTGTSLGEYKVAVLTEDSFKSLVERLAGEMKPDRKCIVSVDDRCVTACMNFPHWDDQAVMLVRELTVEAKAWLHGIENVSSAKGLAEFLEDYGDYLNAPDDVHQANRLDLVTALTNLRVAKRSEGTIEHRPHGDKAEFVVASKATSSTNIELPVTLYATPQLHVGRNKAYRIKVRINYSVDDHNGVSVRCRVVNSEDILLRSKMDLAEDLDLELVDGKDSNIIVVV